MNVANKAKQETAEVNRVELTGKVSRFRGLRYTPSGDAIAEILVAVTQSNFEKKSVGYFDVQVSGDKAIEIAQDLKIGKRISLKGNLWMRHYVNQQGYKVMETKIIAETIQVESQTFPEQEEK